METRRDKTSFPFKKISGLISTYKRLKMISNYDPEVLLKVFRMKLSIKKRIFMLGTPTHENLGDHIIALSEKAFFKKYFPEYLYIDCIMLLANYNIDILERNIRQEDIICISGGGWLGSNWKADELFVRKVIKTFPENLIVILPQTVFYENDEAFSKEGAEIYSTHKNLLFCLRDRSSYEYVINNGFVSKENAFLMPDFALLYEGFVNKGVHRQEVANICLRDDVEKILSLAEEQEIEKTITKIIDVKNYSTMAEETVVRTDQREKLVLAKLNELSYGKFLVTDRLHAMIFAAIVGTPCLAFDNVTHKVYGVYEWIKDLDYIWIADRKESLEKQILALNRCLCKKSINSLDFSEYEKNLRQLILKMSRCNNL